GGQHVDRPCPSTPAACAPARPQPSTARPPVIPRNHPHPVRTAVNSPSTGSGWRPHEVPSVCPQTVDGPVRSVDDQTQGVGRGGGRAPGGDHPIGGQEVCLIRLVSSAIWLYR